MPMGKSWEEWIADYAQSHQNKWNRLTHLFGIPMIVIGIALGVLAFIWGALWAWAAGFFILGWALQFLGHAIEGKKPEFFRDWRFLFVGLRWWFSKIIPK